MSASPAQIAANRANAQRSSGPKTVAGKEASRRNALKHGLTGRGIVVPGEDEQEIGIRVAALEDQLVPEGDVVAALLVRQVAIASVRIERAYRHESALASERMRRAGDLFDDHRHALVADLMEDLANDAPTARRRLMMAPEGVDALLGRLHGLREKADPRRFVTWEGDDGIELNHCLGQMTRRGPLTRVGLLTRGISWDEWDGLDPAALAGLDQPGRKLWAAGELHTIISAEVKRLEAHKTTLDPSRAEIGRAEAPERAILDLGAQGTALRRYAGAAERSMLKILAELRMLRTEATRSVAERAASAPPEVAAVLNQNPAQLADPYEVYDKLGSYCLPPLPYRRVGLASVVGDGKTSVVPVTVGVAPPRSRPTGP